MIRLDRTVQLYGWIHSSLVESNGRRGTIQKEGVRVRLDPKTDRGNVIGLLQKGKTVSLLSTTGDWFKISMPENKGWVSPGSLASS